MLTAYESLNESMMAYFRGRFPRRSHQRRAAATAISFLILLNILSVASLLRALGIGFLSADAARVTAMILFVVIFLANHAFATRRGNRSDVDRIEAATPKTMAVIYMLASATAFIGAFALEWNSR